MNISDVICLDDRYSTTRLVSNKRPSIESKCNQKLEFTLFSPQNINRKGEGGLRTNGYYKNIENPTKEEESTCSLPIVSVVTVVFNGENNLERTIKSVISQTYKNVEYIIIDGGSTDGTLDIIKKYEHAIDYWVSEPDTGIYDAWNKGVRLSTGKWIAFIGADDTYEENAIQEYINYINTRTSIDPEYVSSKVNLFIGNKKGRVIGNKWKWNIFKKYMNTAHVGSLHNRTLFSKYGLFDTEYNICGDYELLLRPRNNLRAEFVDSVTANMDLGGVSNQNKQVFEETLKAKVVAGGRSKLLSQIDKVLAISKWRIRNWVSNKNV
jgi:glycosyltransferase involved in cell wall biosynthesis